MTLYFDALKRSYSHRLAIAEYRADVPLLTPFFHRDRDAPLRCLAYFVIYSPVCRQY